MKLLYLTFQEDAPLYLGVKRKIQGQAAAFEKLGYTVTYSMWKERTFSFYGAEPFQMNIGSGPVMRQFWQIALSYAADYKPDVLYIRLDRISRSVVRLCRLARKAGTKKILIEIPNYPYRNDYIRNIQYAKGLKARVLTGAKIALNILDDSISGRKLKALVDGAVLYGNHAESFYGVPAVNADNGIDTDAIPVVPPRPFGKEAVLLGVAGTLWWQAYDRVLRGMKAYKDAPGENKTRVKFILVGGDKTEMPGFLALVKELGLQEDVVCPGFQVGEELNATYQKADLGISTLGCFRRGITRCSSLKAREYAAAGLPFLYAYDDDSLTGNEPFALRISNDETPVDIQQVLAFLDTCKENPVFVQEERTFAEQNYDWKAIMQRILEAFSVK